MGTRTLEHVPWGTTTTLQVRVWDNALFASWEDAAAAGGVRGESALFPYSAPVFDTMPPLPDQLLMNDLRAFAVVPEPSTIALSVLAAIGVFAFRRRQLRARR